MIFHDYAIAEFNGSNIFRDLTMCLLWLDHPLDSSQTNLPEKTILEFGVKMAVDYENRCYKFVDRNTSNWPEIRLPSDADVNSIVLLYGKERKILCSSGANMKGGYPHIVTARLSVYQDWYGTPENRFSRAPEVVSVK